MRTLPSFMADELREGWSLIVTEPGAHALPGDIPADALALPAIVPGTLAAALEAAGRFDRNAPEPLIDIDCWYRCSLSDAAPGPAILLFEGLATIAEIFLDDRLILSSTSMFESHDVAVDLTGGEILSICFRALKPHLEKTGPRARWRPRLMNAQGLRFTRTTALGFMPGWAPEIHAVGPWRPVSLIRPADNRISDLSVSTDLRGETGILKVTFACDGPAETARLICDGRETDFVLSDGRHSAELHLPGIKPWWPHTHGEPALHDVAIRFDAADLRLPPVGFRTIRADRGANGQDFALVVNGERIFCRGAVWTSADIISLPGDRAAYEPWLRLARDSGMNMIRIPGIAAYESRDFFALCDELGIMVWQDLMFANYDYPAGDAGFVAHVKTEVEQFLTATQASASLAIVCGGSEIFQQAAMLGLPERIWKTPFVTEILRDLADGLRPDLPYVENSPSGGALPFFPNAGIAHYYGVGAYRRPLEDARRANIRFAGECLAFSNLADDETLSGGKSGIPRDTGADWDFEDVRNHYVGDLYGTDSVALRETDFDRYVALSRAVTGEAMEATFAEWRRPGSSCNGALTFTFQDVMSGPGWGVVGADGRPKPAWYALKRAFRPLQLLLSDEGTNGLDIHVINETQETRELTVEVTCLRDGKTPVVFGRRDISLAGRASASLPCTDLFGAFFDTTYAYRFGPPSHDVTVAKLHDRETGELVAEAFHFPIGRANAIHDATIETSLRVEHGRFVLELGSDVLAQSVSISVEGYRPSDNWFHLAPGITRHIELMPLGKNQAMPTGTVRSLGGDRILRF